MYCSRITRAATSAFVLLIDQSGSMQERVIFNGSSMTKAEAVALAANTLLAELVNRSRREEGVRDYFEVAALGYSGRGIYPLLNGKNSKGPLRMIAISQLAAINTPVRSYLRERELPDGRSMITTSARRFWIEPHAEGNTPMFKALESARSLVQRWCNAPGHKNSFPPVVINITDGEASDAPAEKLLDAAARIRSASTSDGNALLLNIHITTGGDGTPIIFPSSAGQLGETGYGRLLFDMSSQLPECYNASVAALKREERQPGGVGISVIPRVPNNAEVPYTSGASGSAEATDAPSSMDGTPGPYQGMSYNCPIADLLVMIGIGTVSVNLIR